MTRVAVTWATSHSNIFLISIAATRGVSERIKKKFVCSSNNKQTKMRKKEINRKNMISMNGINRINGYKMKPT